MKYFAILAAATVLGGCEAARVVAPQTTAGFETGGVLGALDGASGAILAKCKTLDGVSFRVAVDTVGETVGQGDLVDRVRAARKKACATAGRVAAFVDEPTFDETVEEPITEAEIAEAGEEAAAAIAESEANTE
ncbi:MAG: hypothetical protein AAF439_07110 [Pseudomonadota bacterium]